MAIEIERVNCNFEREPLIRPFGFKGGYITDVWQSVAALRSRKGNVGVGLGTQSVLWSDSAVFAANTEAGSNALMFAMTQFALKCAKARPFTTPLDLFDQVEPEVWEYGKKITGNPALRLTFALNALVPVDNAAWVLYARENGIASFDKMVPPAYRAALSHRHEKLASVPLMTYGIPLPEIVEAVRSGYFFLKIKIGSDPDHDGSHEKMLEWDKQRIEAIHRAIGQTEVAHTRDGKIPYYLDANGRYDSKDRLQRLLDHARKIGMIGQIAIVEEPFPEESEAHVGDLGVRVAADESAHSDKDIEQRVQMGYGAIALKPIAKTLSMTLRMLAVAARHDIPCFCADLGVSPIMVDWNKNFAARLKPLPGMDIGVIETNGHQNYKRWDMMCRRHPCFGAPWTKTVAGVFNLDRTFYEQSGGIFEISKDYAEQAPV